MTCRRLRRWTAAACAAALLVWADAGLDARAPTVRQRFESARAAEAEARAVVARVDTRASAAVEDRVVRQARRAAIQYEGLVRRFPTSSYSDDALFNAGTLMQWLHGRFGRDADRASASKYLTWLLREYPASRHVRDAKLATRALEAPPTRQSAPPARTAETAPAPSAVSLARTLAPRTAPPTPSPSVPASTAAVAAPSLAAVDGLAPTTASTGAPAGPPTLHAISRVVLDDTVRVTLALDREAPFTHEILAGPPRAFVDLFGATTSDALQDASVKYDAEAVRQVRVGRRPGAVRVVLDLTAATGVSVYTLYNPFRVVIDADRAQGARPLVAAAEPAVPPTLPSRDRVAGRLRRSVAAPEPLPPPVEMPADAAVVLTVETAGVPAAVVAPATANIAPAPAVEAAPALPLPAPLEPEPSLPRESAAGPGDAAAPPSSSVDTRPGPMPAASVTTAPPLPVPAADVAPTPPPASPSANTDGSFSLARQLGLGVSRIVIDPGHGGRDPGTLAHGSSEAKLVLDVALRLEKMLEREGLEVVLTRRTDVYIPLEERTAIANRERADLFLSIHANASRDPKARGTETYYLSFASNPEAETVAARENATSAGGMHNLTSIVRAIALNNKLDESRDLAGMVQRALAVQLSKGAAGSRSRGIKKAPFVVLIGAAMPSVLAEIGFITNRAEAGLIKTPAYRQRIAESLRDAVVQYQRSLKRATTVATTGR